MNEVILVERESICVIENIFELSSYLGQLTVTLSEPKYPPLICYDGNQVLNFVPLWKHPALSPIVT